MSNGELATLVVTLAIALCTGIAALVVYLVKATYRWGRTEQRLEEVLHQVKTLVTDKDAVHKEIMATLRYDREATNKRLRWLEERIWGRGASP